MTICLPIEVKNTNKLLKALSDNELNTFINDSRIYIFTLLSKKYYIPLESNDEIPLKVNVVDTSNIVNASTGNFINYDKDDYISINKDVFLIVNKISDSQIQVSRTLTYTANNLNALFFPEAIYLIIKYFAARLALLKEFADQSYNQDTIPFFKNFDSIYNPIIKAMIDCSWSSSRIKELGSGSNTANNRNDILSSSNSLSINVKINSFRKYTDCNSNSINHF